MVRQPNRVGEGAPATASSWVRVDCVSTPPGGLVEYRPSADLVALATGPKRDIEVIEADAPPRRLEVTAGQVHILPANVAVAVRLLGQAENIVVTLHPRLFEEEVAGPRVALRSAFGLRDPLIEELVQALNRETTCRSADSHYLQSLGAALAAHLVRKYARRGESRPPTRRSLVKPGLAAVLEYIEKNMDGRLALSTLARVARLSVFAFVRNFKGATGVPPHRYIIRRRVERAKELLGDGTLSVADVALRCGFRDQSAFTTAFRRVTWQTPRAFRDMLTTRPPSLPSSKAGHS